MPQFWVRAVLLAGVVVSVVWFCVRLGQFAREMRNRGVREMPEGERETYLASAEYQRLRNSVRQPIFVTLLLLLALVTSLRFK